MIKHVLCAAAVLAATPVLAQEKPTFNGAYIGIQGGWQDDQFSVNASAGGVNAETGISKSGFAYGGQFGYDVRVGSGVVLGGEIALSGRTGALPLRDIYQPIDPDFGVEVDPSNSLRFTQGLTVGVTGRVGYLVSDSGLAYVRGGYSNTTYILRDNDNSESSSRGGFQIGGGYEQYVTPHVSVRLEYAYSQYGTNDLLQDENLPNLENIDYSTKLSRNAVLLGVNYRF